MASGATTSRRRSCAPTWTGSPPTTAARSACTRDHLVARRDGPGQGRRRRPRGRRHAPLLGIPIVAKDLFDTKDMPTTGGSPVFEGFQPTKDAWQVRQDARGRRDHHGQGQPGRVRQRRPLLAERLRPGVERVRSVQVARSAPPAARPWRSRRASPPRAWARRPATRCGARRARPRSCRCAAPTACSRSTGAMPLTYIQDYAGAISRSLPDLALLLNATTIDDPADILDDVANGAPARGLDRRRWMPTRSRARSSACRDGVRRSVPHAPGTRTRCARQFTHFVAARRDRQGDHRPAGRSGARRRATAATRAGASGSLAHPNARTRTRRRSSAARCACRSSATPTRTPAPAR